ncbi:MAG: DUF1593 domain-containing protein, partial [Opitutales bacterium]|nr:DUF1593 domain-containing protein [Opitutales bacterium]
MNPQLRNPTGRASRHLRTLFVVLAVMLGATLTADNPRVIITSDIGGTERDDEQSFVRLLLYSNELDIVGLIGTNSQFGGSERGEVQVFKNIIDVYAGIRNNLQAHAQVLAHAAGYPTATYLKSICKYGRRDIKDMNGVGDNKATDGSTHIIAELKKADPRPLWFCVWGSNSTLAQALWDLQRERDNGTLTQAQLDAIIAKIRIYDIAGQCTTGAWIAHTFPNIFYIRSTKQFQAFAKHNTETGLPWQGPTDMVDYDWFRAHIRNLENTSHLGNRYPKATSMYEGDSPSFVYLLSKGLNDPEKPWMGSWGGRFGREMTSPAGR